MYTVYTSRGLEFSLSLSLSLSLSFSLELRTANYVNCWCSKLPSQFAFIPRHNPIYTALRAKERREKSELLHACTLYKMHTCYISPSLVLYTLSMVCEEPKGVYYKCSEKFKFKLDEKHYL